MVSLLGTRTLEPHAFVAAEWLPAAAATLTAPVPLKMLTWNVWFGAHARQARSRALLAELARRSPDVIMLQEVTRGLLSAITETPWVRRRYQISDIDGSTFGRYGVLLLSRIPIQRLGLLELPTEMGRCLLVAELACGLTVATVHLESTSDSAQTRATQLRIIQPYLAEISPDVIFAGDMNFKPDAEVENAALDPTFVDVWSALYKNDPGYTVDTHVNFMRYVVDGEHSHKRIDRVFLRSRTWTAHSATLVGVTPIDEEANFISDHFGLEVEFSVP